MVMSLFVACSEREEIWQDETKKQRYTETQDTQETQDTTGGDEGQGML